MGKIMTKARKYPEDHVLRLLNPNLTDEDIDNYYRDTAKALDEIRTRRILGEAAMRNVVLD